MADTLRRLRPDLDKYIPLGTPGLPRPPQHEVNHSKSEAKLGLKCEYSRSECAYIVKKLIQIEQKKRCCFMAHFHKICLIT